jgi:hypothetical protein
MQLYLQNVVYENITDASLFTQCWYGNITECLTVYLHEVFLRNVCVETLLITCALFILQELYFKKAWMETL